MDWSSVYEEHGEEEGDWSSWSNRLDPLLEKIALKGKYSPMVCYALTVNYILGVGCLGIPFAFLQSGIVFGTLIMIFLTLITLMTVLWVAEAGHRAIQMRLKLSSRTPSNSQLDKLTKNNKEPPINYNSIAASEKILFPGVDINQTSELFHGPLHEETETTSLVSEFLGPYWSIFYQSSLILLTSVGSLAYAQVFINTFISQLWPTCSVYIPMLIFGAMVVPLSCIDLAEQVNIQLIMAGLRFFSLGIIIIGILIAIAVDSTDSNNISNSFPNNNKEILSPPYLATNIPYFQFSGFGVIFTTGIFSQLFQHSVPGLIRPLSLHHKRSVPSIFGAALLTTGAIYIITGIGSVCYFGSNTKESINLNFVNFHWGISSDYTSYYIVGFLSMIVVIFPALDTISIYPLIAHTLAGNLNAFFPHTYKLFELFIPNKESINGKDVRDRTLFFWRLIASAPPVLFSAFTTDLSISLQVAGICGLLVALVTPALLQQYSMKVLKESNPEQSLQLTPYSSWMSWKGYTYVVLIIALFAFFICFTQLFISISSG